MAKKSNFLGSAIRKLGRAWATKDERAFDAAMDDLEEHIEQKDEEEEPDTIEVHNHIPDSRDAMGEMPPRDPPGFDRRGHDRRDNEEPPWLKNLQEDMRRMNDSIEGLKKAEEDRRHDDRRHDDGGNLENLGEYAENDETATEENLEMDRHRDRRHDDRRHDDRRDEPSEREEMAERIREKSAERDNRHDDRRHDDRRGADKRDEANKEILGELEFEAPPGTGDRARKARDSAYLEEAFQDALAKAEVLAPGIQLPTFDRAASPLKTLGQIQRLRKTALDLAYNKAETRGVIDSAMSGRTLDTRSMKLPATRVLFNAAAAAIAQGNNRRATDRSTSVGGGSQTAGGGIQSLAQLNQANKKFYGHK